MLSTRSRLRGSRGNHSNNLRLLQSVMTWYPHAPGADLELGTERLAIGSESVNQNHSSMLSEDAQTYSIQLAITVGRIPAM